MNGPARERQGDWDDSPTSFVKVLYQMYCNCILFDHTVVNICVEIYLHQLFMLFEFGENKVHGLILSSLVTFFPHKQ